MCVDPKDGESLKRRLEKDLRSLLGGEASVDHQRDHEGGRAYRASPVAPPEGLVRQSSPRAGRLSSAVFRFVIVVVARARQEETATPQVRLEKTSTRVAIF